MPWPPMGWKWSWEKTLRVAHGAEGRDVMEVPAVVKSHEEARVQDDHGSPVPYTMASISSLSRSVPGGNSTGTRRRRLPDFSRTRARLK